VGSEDEVSVAALRLRLVPHVRQDAATCALAVRAGVSCGRRALVLFVVEVI